VEDEEQSRANRHAGKEWNSSERLCTLSPIVFSFESIQDFKSASLFDFEDIQNFQQGAPLDFSNLELH
jgi:hypothetical protein